MEVTNLDEYYSLLQTEIIKYSVNQKASKRDNLYYTNFFDKTEEQQQSDLSNIDDEKYKKELCKCDRILINNSKLVVKFLYEIIKYKESNEIELIELLKKEYLIKKMFHIASRAFIFQINQCLKEEKYVLAIKMQTSALTLFKNNCEVIKSFFHVDLFETPLKKCLNVYLKDLETAINIDKINILQNSKIHNEKRDNSKEDENIVEYPFNDKKVLDNFKIYTDKFIVEPYVDYSYLFQRLRNLNLIQHITHSNFMNWLKDNDYITEKTFDTFLNHQFFRSLNKSTSTQRENNFNNVFSQSL